MPSFEHGVGDLVEKDNYATPLYNHLPPSIDEKKKLKFGTHSMV